MKPKHQRLTIIIISLISAIGGVLLILSNLRENLIYFYSPTEIFAKPEIINSNKKIRLGGLVKKNSLKKTGENEIYFAITDNKKQITVKYKGIPPILFREEQGVIAEGHFLKNAKSDINSKETPIFSATTLLAKHDERYMPREIYLNLRKNNSQNKQYINQ